MVWLLSLTQTIVIPVVTAAILASVLAPLVRRLKRRGVPRGAGAAIVLLLIVVAGAALAVLVLTGISAQSGDLNAQLQSAANKVEGWLKDLGVSSQTASQAEERRERLNQQRVPVPAARTRHGPEGARLPRDIPLLHRAQPVLPAQGRAGDQRPGSKRHMGVPRPVARTISGRTIGSMQGYFAGVTAIAAFNGIVIGLGALVLGVPLAGSIAVVNFVAAYIPYLGAWTAGRVHRARRARGGGTVDGADHGA